jgi:hypothetical protein
MNGGECADHGADRVADEVNWALQLEVGKYLKNILSITVERAVSGLIKRGVSDRPEPT